MSVFQYVKAYAGKQDINWGDSSTTFDRKTYTGGVIQIYHVDAECIPSTTLGGYVGDNLHIQNTDSGTTDTSFEINSGGNSATLATTGLSADREFTFPDTSDQELVGATDLGSVNNALGASTVGIEDAAGDFAATDVEAALVEVATDITSLESQVFDRGYKYGFDLDYSASSVVTISGGMWSHAGATNQMVYTDSQLTFTLGSAGDNGDSDDLGANELHYIYIDDSAIITAGVNLLTVTEFLNKTTEPTYSHSKTGWYNGNDRCIGSVLTDASNNILDFRTRSKNYYVYVDGIDEYHAAVGTTWVATSLTAIPIFATVARLHFDPAANEYIHIAVETPAIASGTTRGESYYIATNCDDTIDAPLSDTQQLTWRTANNQITWIITRGYYLDSL